MNIAIKRKLNIAIRDKYSLICNTLAACKMSCISNNFSSFFLDSLNDPSEFAKYLGNAENKAHSIDDQIFNSNSINGTSLSNSSGCESEIVSFYQNDAGNISNSLNYMNTTSQNSQEITLNSTHYDSPMEFPKYLRHSEYGETTQPNNLIDLDNTPLKRSATSMDISDIDHDSKTIFDVHSSNESTCEQRASSNTSECSDSSNQTNASKPLNKFSIKDNFDVHPAHKVEEGIFQHMNKLPNKKKDTLKQLGVTFTGHMSVNDKSIIVDNFAKFCQEYSVTDHRPFLTLNQSGMQKPEQIKFARYLGQGLPNFTLFCIYSNFKNIFCTKRFENYAKGDYNLHYIIDKTKRFLTCTTADLKNLTTQMCEVNEIPAPTNGNLKQEGIKTIENLTILENFEVSKIHCVEDGIFTHMTRLAPKKQELLKQLGVQNNCNVSLQEKLRIIENFIRFCKEYKITDHRPFLDFNESGLPKSEQIKFTRYLGQGLPNLTLFKIYSAFKDILSFNRLEKFISEGYQLDIILKKKKKNLLNRISAAVCKENAEAAKQANLNKTTT